MKKLVAIFLVSIMMLFLLGSCDNKDYIPDSPDEDFEYDKVKFTEKETNNIWITKYVGDDDVVKVPSQINGSAVVGIQFMAFAKTDVKKVILPDSVSAIWEGAFMDCTSLTEVVFGKKLKAIYEQAFQGCTALEKVTFPSSLTTIEESAFLGCSSLRKVILPKSITTMGDGAFADCGIEELIIEDGTVEFGRSSAFWNCNIKALTIPASVESVADHTFYEGLERVTFLGDAPNYVGESPFGRDAVIYYYPNTEGWDDTELKNYYTLKPIE